MLDKHWLWTIAIFVALMVTNIIANGTSTISYNNGRLSGPIIDVFIDVPPLLMIAIGMTLVIATKGIDLSVGSVMAVSGAAAMQFLSNSDSDNWGSVLAALGLACLVGTVIGMFSGYLVSAIRLQPFITTLIMMLAGRGIANLITDGRNAEGGSELFNSIAQGRVLGFPRGFLFAAVILIIVIVIVRRTALGMTIEAVGINPTAAHMAGIKSARILFLVYVVSGLLAAIAGIFSVAYIGRVEVASSGTGAAMEMDAILAVVIGGTSLAGGKFSLWGSTLGAFIITALNDTVVYLGVSSAAIPAFKAIVIIFICLMQSPQLREKFTRRKPKVDAGSAPSAPSEGAAA